MLSVRESQGYGSHVSGAYRENNGFCTDPALNCDGENSMRFTAPNLRLTQPQDLYRRDPRAQELSA